MSQPKTLKAATEVSYDEIVCPKCLKPQHNSIIKLYIGEFIHKCTNHKCREPIRVVTVPTVKVYSSYII